MKTYTIRMHKIRMFRDEMTRDITGTLPELLRYFSYTLETGKSWEYERGNKKINTQPKTGASLVTNLNNAETNAAANGFSSVWYELI